MQEFEESRIIYTLARAIKCKLYGHKFTIQVEGFIEIIIVHSIYFPLILKRERRVPTIYYILIYGYTGPTLRPKPLIQGPLISQIW